MWIRIEDRADPTSMSLEEMEDEGKKLCQEIDHAERQITGVENALHAQMLRRASMSVAPPKSEQHNSGVAPRDALAHMENERAIGRLNGQLASMRREVITLERRLDALDLEYSTRERREQAIAYYELSEETMF